MTEALREFLEQHDRTVEPLYAAYMRRFWAMSVDGGSGQVEALIEAKQRYLDVFNDRGAFDRIRQWRESRAAGDGSLLARWLDHVYRSFVPYQIDERALSEMVRRETEIENTFNTFRADFEGTPASDNALRQILRQEREPGRRRRAWEAAKQVGAAVAEDLIGLVELRNREARRLGYADYYELMLATQELEEPWLFGLLDELEARSERTFAAVKADLDRELKARFSLDARESHPWLYSDPFFQELPAAAATGKLDAIFRDQDIAALTRGHFQSLGMEIDDLLALSDLYERDGKSQHAFCLDVNRSGEVRVLGNVLPDERWMSIMLHEFGHAVYDKYIDRSLPFSLREPAHTFTTEAIAMLNGRLTKSPPWLVRFAGVPAETAARLGPEVFQAIRASMLIFLRWAIMLVRFERELYRDPRQPLDRLWWRLVERIQHVTPPPDRAMPDWAAKIHLATAPVYYQNYILGELMASQVLGFIEREVAPGGDLFSPEVGRYLIREVFEPGARWNWSALIEKATGAALEPEHFLRQFDI